MDARDEFAKKLREYRERRTIVKDGEPKKMLQEDLAERIGRSQTAVSTWENGKQRPDDVTLINIQSALELDDDELDGLALLRLRAAAEEVRHTAENRPVSSPTAG